MNNSEAIKILQGLKLSDIGSLEPSDAFDIGQALGMAVAALERETKNENPYIH